MEASAPASPNLTVTTEDRSQFYWNNPSLPIPKNLKSWEDLTKMQVCRHDLCISESCDKERRTPYERTCKRNEHERRHRCHPCPPGCKCCEHWGDKREGTKPTVTGLWCGHYDCARYFSDKSSLIAHQNETHFRCNPEKCALCTANARKIAERKRRAEAEAKAKEERFKRLKAQVDEYQKAVTSIDWNKVINEHLGESPEAFQATMIRETLVQQLKRPFAECLAFLLRQSPETIEYLKKEVLRDEEDIPRPTLEALLAYKDVMQISDEKWTYTASLFGLKYATIASIRTLRRKINSELPVTPTPGGQGAEIPVIEYLKWLLQHSPPPQDNTTPIKIKFAFDGGTMTSKRRVQEEIGTFELLYDVLTISQLKSPKNAHQYIIYIGGESTEEYQQQLRNVVDAISFLENGGSISVNGLCYTFEPFLVCDLKALVCLLGLYKVSCLKAVLFSLTYQKGLPSLSIMEVPVVQCVFRQHSKFQRGIFYIQRHPKNERDWIESTNQQIRKEELRPGKPRNHGCTNLHLQVGSHYSVQPPLRNGYNKETLGTPRFSDRRKESTDRF